MEETPVDDSNNEDQLDPAKIKGDIEPFSERQLERQAANTRRYRFGRNLSLALATLSLFLPLLYKHDPRPYSYEKLPLTQGQILLYSDPLGADVLFSDNRVHEAYLGQTGRPLSLDSLENGAGNIALLLRKKGYKDIKLSISREELQSSVWPDKKSPRPIPALQSKNPGAYLWYYLRLDQPLCFVLFCLGLMGAAFHQALYKKGEAWQRRRREVLLQAEETDALSGLSVLSHLVLSPLGRGGTSTLYTAVTEEDFTTKRVVRFSREESLDKKSVARWEREADIYEELEHPHVVETFGAQRFGHTFCFVMEFIEGQNMKEFLTQRSAEGKMLSLKEALPLFEKIAAGLDAAHAKGITHRDIKPANIMLRKDGSPVIVDLGLATHMKFDITSQIEFKGTPLYFAPEQAEGLSPDKKDIQSVDQFALGLILYEALSGEFPYSKSGEISEILQRDQKPAKPFLDVAPQYGPEISDAVMKMLEIRPENRYKTCGEAISAVKKAFLSQKSQGATS